MTKKKIDKLSKQVERISILKEEPLRNLMTTAMPEGVRRKAEKN